VRKHADVRDVLLGWSDVVKEAHWSQPMELKDDFKSASFVGPECVIFNIKGNSYRLVVLVDYEEQAVQIEWFGTHAEYSRKSFP